MGWQEEMNKIQEKRIDAMPLMFHLRSLLSLCCIMIKAKELSPDEHTIKAWIPLLRRIHDALDKENDPFMNKDLVELVAWARLTLES